MPQVAVKISDASFAKLKRLAHQRMVNYATVIEAALSAYQPETSANSELASLIQNDRQDVIDSVLTRLEALETQLAAMQAGTAQSRAVGDAAAQGIVGQPQEQETAEIAVGNELEASGDNRDADGMGEKIEANADTSLHPVPMAPAPAKPVKEVIAELIASGMRSPTRIANTLNATGHRTKNGTRYERSAPMIAKALKAVGG